MTGVCSTASSACPLGAGLTPCPLGQDERCSRWREVVEGRDEAERCFPF